MISQSDQIEAGQAAHERTVWGLSTVELHEAYWRSRGVQVVERGSPVRLQRHAELYLLIEPERLVLFDIRAAADRMAWNNTTVMRIRLSPGDRIYCERIIEDESGEVRRVERVYSESLLPASRIILTRNEKDARIWKSASSRREAWKQIRSVRPYFRVEHVRLPGTRCIASCESECEQFLNELVARWEDPARAIEGIAELRPGVVGIAGTVIADDQLLIPPVWLGHLNGDTPAMVVGPRCERDSPHTDPSQLPVSLREIRYIAPADAMAAGHEYTAVRRGGYARVKRMLDVLLSSAALVLLMPVLAAVALAIMLDDGRPVIYRHRRQTAGGREFDCCKFRTMRRNADALKARLAKENVCDGPQFFIRNDPRVTRIGRMLRRFHLDELPQFWNVLKGEMSIVGPRPSPDSENQLCPAWRETRLSVRPGITGLWQVERTRQPGLDFQEWIRFDTEYVENMSLMLDARILFKTVLRTIGRRGT